MILLHDQIQKSRDLLLTTLKHQVEFTRIQVEKVITQVLHTNNDSVLLIVLQIFNYNLFILIILNYVFAGNQSGQQKAELNQNEKPTNQHWNNGILQREINPQDTGEVVICRRVENENIPIQNNLQDKFGRSTNMKMISFTDSQSATLPHFPTQQVGVPYPHCSTMPLPPVIPPPIIHPPCNYPRHTTIPSHHNGVRLFTPNIYGKRVVVNRYPQHHSFPQLMSPLKFNLKHISERDSANFSMASSGDGETYRS